MKRTSTRHDQPRQSPQARLLAACSSGGSSSAGGAAASGGSGSSPAAAATPAGFYSMSTANCTNPAQDTKKITGTLTLGWSGPFSGPISPFADAVVQGAKDRFALQNQAGGVGGVKLAIATKDDQFNPAMTKSNVDGWIQSGSVQAVTEFGSGPLAAVAADQNLACLPNLFVNATDDTYRDISKYPWTTEFLPSNTVEEAAEVKVIQAELSPAPAHITVAVAEDSDRIRPVLPGRPAGRGQGHQRDDQEGRELRHRPERDRDQPAAGESRRRIRRARWFPSACS